MVCSGDGAFFIAFRTGRECEGEVSLVNDSCQLGSLGSLGSLFHLSCEDSLTFIVFHSILLENNGIFQFFVVNSRLFREYNLLYHCNFDFHLSLSGSFID